MDPRYRTNKNPRGGGGGGQTRGPKPNGHERKPETHENLIKNPEEEISRDMLNCALLTRIDPEFRAILKIANQTAIYTFNTEKNCWVSKAILWVILLETDITEVCLS